MIHECVCCNLHGLGERQGAIRGNVFSLTSCNSLAFQASVRYSGTETKARVMIEGMDEVAIKRHADAIAEALERACRN